MQMKFTKELPVWLAPGIKPPESLTSDGWKASQNHQLIILIGSLAEPTEL